MCLKIMSQTSEKTSLPSNFSIRILNLEDGELLSYSLALVKGQVVSNDQSLSKGTICVQSCDTCTQWPLINGKFKALLNLCEGWNDFNFSYECCMLSFKLQFQLELRSYCVVPIYVISHDHDGQFQGPENFDCSVLSARTRIALAARLLQTIIAEKLWELGLGRRTFMLKRDVDCWIHTSPLSIKIAQSMKQEQLWEYYGRELVKTFGYKESSYYKFLTFLSCTRYEGSNVSEGMLYEDILGHTKGHVALGGGGLALFGTGCLHTWPASETEVLKCINNTTSVDQKILMDDSCYRGTYGGCFSTTLGSVLHELCHTFDLGHTDKGVMGRGFDHMDLVFGALDSTKDVIINAHSTVDFTVNLKVACIIQNQYQIASLPRKSKVQVCDQHLPFANCTDKTFFTKSCAFILAYHRWFNSFSDVFNCDLKFDNLSWTLRSSAGVRVVEVREGDRQLVRTSWCFSPARQVFVVPRSSLPINQPLLLVAQDNLGNILRYPLSAHF